MAQKNLKADLTNPNVYHSIDENNEEHVYDEIKHKEGNKDPGESVQCKFCLYEKEMCTFTVRILTPYKFHVSVFLSRA